MTERDPVAGQRWWQRCRWDVIGQTYEPPRGFKFGGGVEPSWLPNMAQGFTTLTLRCTLCGDVRTRIYTGKVTIDGR